MAGGIGIELSNVAKALSSASSHPPFGHLSLEPRESDFRGWTPKASSKTSLEKLVSSTCKLGHTIGASYRFWLQPITWDLSVIDASFRYRCLMTTQNHYRHHLLLVQFCLLFLRLPCL